MAILDVVELDGCTVGAKPVRRFALRNADGMVVELMDFGATVLSVKVPSNDGSLVSIACALASPQDYADNPAYMGATCGRYAGRIANARCLIGTASAVLTNNDGKHHLHGGSDGFNHRLWLAQPFSAAGVVGVRFETTSQHLDQGYPGQLTCQVEITLDNNGGLQFGYQAQVSGQPTVVNLTHHGYWNLRGYGDVLGHKLQLSAERVLEIDAELIPTGALLPVADTAFDFREPRIIGQQVQQLAGDTGGFDHCFVQASGAAKKLRCLAKVTEPDSGRGLNVSTDQPGLVFYTGNFLDGAADVGGFRQHEGFALECQQLPDAPNHPAFPSTLLHPGETYQQTTRYDIVLP